MRKNDPTGLPLLASWASMKAAWQTLRAAHDFAALLAFKRGLTFPLPEHLDVTEIFARPAT
jgi:hypothetical protein